VFFGIELEDVREAWKLDEADRKRLRWEFDGGRPYLVIRFMPSVYRRSQVPEGLILPLSMSVRGKRFVFTE
jgi:hypothetical protein